MKRILPFILLLVVVGGAGWLLFQRLGAAPPPGTLYGNVEIRQVDLAFNAEGAVISMAKREGERVKQGEVVAEIDPAMYKNVLDLAVARRDSVQAQFDLLLAGTRVEDIDQAQANLANAQASVANTQNTFARQSDLAARNVSSQQALDDARLALDSARARVAQTKAALAEAIAGPRVEDIAAARANLRAAAATVELARTQMERTHLLAPADGTVMTRVIEPGTVVLPAASVYSMAIDNETWIRAFAPETLLGQVASGIEVTIRNDTNSTRAYRGKIGYVSPVAEFTPKTVETPELRTQLVYRLRIRIEDADDGLRQGMPVTISLPVGK